MECVNPIPVVIVKMEESVKNSRMVIALVCAHRDGLENNVQLM